MDTKVGEKSPLGALPFTFHCLKVLSIGGEISGPTGTIVVDDTICSTDKVLFICKKNDIFPVTSEKSLALTSKSNLYTDQNGQN